MLNPGQIQLHLLAVPRGNTGILGEMPVANGALDDNQHIICSTSMCVLLYLARKFTIYDIKDERVHANFKFRNRIFTGHQTPLWPALFS